MSRERLAGIAIMLSGVCVAALGALYSSGLFSGEIEAVDLFAVLAIVLGLVGVTAGGRAVWRSGEHRK